MGLRLCVLLACAVCAAAFVPACAPRAACQLQCRSAIIHMVTAATKPQRVNKRNYEYNKQYRSEMRTRIKRVLEVVETGDYQVAVPVLSKAFAIIDKNVGRGIVHKNTAARKKRQLHLKVKALEVRRSGPRNPASIF